MKRSSETDLVINLWPPNTLSTRTYNVRKISCKFIILSTEVHLANYLPRASYYAYRLKIDTLFTIGLSATYLPYLLKLPDEFFHCQTKWAETENKSILFSFAQCCSVVDQQKRFS